MARWLMAAVWATIPPWRAERVDLGVGESATGIGVGTLGTGGGERGRGAGVGPGMDGGAGPGRGGTLGSGAADEDKSRRCVDADGVKMVANWWIASL